MSPTDVLFQEFGLLLGSLFAGAATCYCAGPMRRLALRTAPAGMSAIYTTYLVMQIISDSGINIEEAVAQGMQYLLGVAIGAPATIGFLMVTNYGRKIANNELAGVQSDIKKSLDLAVRAIEPKLQSFGKKLEKEIRDDMGAFFQNQRAVIVDTGEKMEELKSTVHKVDGGVVDLSTRLDRVERVASKSEEYINMNPDEKKRQEAKLEAILQILQQKLGIKYESEGGQEENEADRERKGGSSGRKAQGAATKLTAQDGRANRMAGRMHQNEIAQLVRSAGLGADVGLNIGEPDLIIWRLKDGAKKIIAVVSIKYYSLYDQQKRMQRRVSAKDCLPELTLAKKLKVPMIVIVTNRINGRRWARIVSVDEQKGWKGVSTPVMLAKNDRESGQMLQEEFASVIVKLGGKA